MKAKKRQYDIIYMQVEGGRVLLFILNSSSQNVNLFPKSVSNELNINLSNAYVKAISHMNGIFFRICLPLLEQLRYKFCLSYKNI